MNPRQDREMDIAVQLFNENCDIRNIQEIKNILDALKKFIVLNKELEDRDDAMLPRIYSFIALCNYKIGNLDRAYWCAKRSIEIGDRLLEESPFVFDKNPYLDPNVYVLVEDLENRYSDRINFDREYEEGEENIYDDSNVKEYISSNDNSITYKPSQQEIKGLLEVLTKIQDNASRFFESQGQGLEGFQYNQMIDMFKLPLYYAWEKFKYGWHGDFMEEGDSLFPYLTFESDPPKLLNDLMKILKIESPFKLLEKNGMITKGLSRIYSHLLSEFEE